MPAPGFMSRSVTGISGLDSITSGGLPRGEVTLVAGATGTGKSVLAAQFLAAGLLGDREPALFVSFEEPPDKTRRFMKGFGWDIAAWEAQGRWAFLDASPSGDREVVVGEDFDLTLLIARIAAAAEALQAKRVALDAISDVLTRIGDLPRVRMELHRLVESMEGLGVTTVVTTERDHDGMRIARYGVEEFVTDNVIILRNTLSGGARRRTVEALKLRGTQHKTGEFPYAILPNEGIVLASMTDLELTHPASDTRLTLGNEELDSMCGGGALKGSVILVSGPTGSGKSLLTTEFAAAAARDGGRSLLVSFEESRAQLSRNARAWGHDLDALQASGRLTVLCMYPESAPAPAHLISIQKRIDDFQPTRVVLDSLSGVERASSPQGFHEFLLGLAASVKRNEITTLLTTTTPWLLGGNSATGVEASTLLDSILLLRYLEVYGELHRGISVLKMRGSNHTKKIREFTITDRGMQVGGTFHATTGILAGQPLIGDGWTPEGTVGSTRAPAPPNPV